MRKGIADISLIFFILVFSFQSGMSQQPIAAVRNLPPGSVVTTTGTITTGDEYGVIRYMQDANAGIALYAASLSATVPGDSIIVTGVLSLYKGELQVSPVMSFQKISSGRPVISIPGDNLKDLNQPAYSARLVSLSCIGITSCESVFDDGPYVMYDQYGHAGRGVISNDQDFIGQPIPASPLMVDGIWTAIDGQYQLLIRDMADASEGSCLLIPPATVTIDNHLTRLTWTNIPSEITYIEWGVQNFENRLQVGLPLSEYSFPPPDVEPGKVYQGRLSQIHDSGDTIASLPVFFSAPSTNPPFEIVFNRSVDASFSDGSSPLATGPAVIESDIIQRIDLVEHTLDIAMYNTGRNPIVQAVNRAYQRGVAVRYIADDETSNSALDNALFPVLFRGEDGIMHNKFVIADVDVPGQAWVWTGSTNFTSNQLSTDPNHAYVIHDQAMAVNYTQEFDELWGTQANHSDGRVGEFKQDNTNHLFEINGSTIESYFSPSDEVDCHILDAISSADHQLLVGLLLLTSASLTNELIAIHQQGVDVRVILEDEESSSWAVSQLSNAGIPLAIHAPSSIFHHKYAIIDEGYPDSDPQVVSGSHNWTWSADHINDENTLIFHDASIANIFRQEYEARWAELNTGVHQEYSSSGVAVYPNPATNFFLFKNNGTQSRTVDILDVSGRIVDRVIILPGETVRRDAGPQMTTGMYFIRTVTAGQPVVCKLILQR